MGFWSANATGVCSSDWKNDGIVLENANESVADCDENQSEPGQREAWEGAGRPALVGYAAEFHVAVLASQPKDDPMSNMQGRGQGYCTYSTAQDFVAFLVNEHRGNSTDPLLSIQQERP